jgi:tetratricopeptide (TPR) repeat protein
VPKSRRIRKEITDKLLADVLFRCCLCPDHVALTLDKHHIEPISESGPNTAENLIVVCPNCHRAIHIARKAGLQQYTPEQLLICKQRWTELCWRGELTMDQRIAEASSISPLPPIFSLPHPRNPSFTGREAILAAAREALLEGGPAALTQAITGLGGVGKTQLALEYAYRHRGSYDVVWWVRSEEPAQLASDYAGLAAPLDLPEKGLADQTAIIRAVRSWLAVHPAWLLIFDNAPTAQAIYDYLPRGGAGHVLVTSRDHAWGAVARPVEVSEFSRHESVEFLRRRTGQEVGAAELAEALGDLPLALEHAAAYVEATGGTLLGYVDHFRTRRKELWKRAESPLGYHATITTTWALSMDRVRTECPAAADLLVLCAFLAPDDIPLSLLRDGAWLLALVSSSLSQVEGDSLILDDALTAFRRYSLATVEEEALSVHRLVQAVTQDRLPEEERRSWAARACCFVDTLFPYEDDEPTTWAPGVRLLPHAMAAAQHAEELSVALAEAGHLLNEVGLCLSREGALELARLTLERALAIGEQVYGPEHPNTATRLGNLALVLQNQGCLEKARELTTLALEMDEKTYGPEHTNVAIRLNNLGLVLMELKNLEEARECIARALAIDERVYGPGHPAVAVDSGNLGSVLKDMGDLEGARECFERALAVMAAFYDSEHPNLATALNQLGCVLQDLRELGEARKLIACALAIDEKVYGADHPEVAIDLNNLGGVLRDFGEREGARACLERALNIFQARFGEAHPKTKLVREEMERL